MEIKDYVTVTLSVLAFGLGLFNLWWGTFRRRIALFFIQGSGFRYALVNGGKTDILVTDVTYWFSGVHSNQATAPVQECEARMPVLLKAGTALQHRVNLTDQEADLKHLFQIARPISDQEARRALTVKAIVDWIDNNGEEHSAEVEVAEATIDHNFFRSWSPRTRRADLSPSRLSQNSVRKPLALMLEWASRNPKGATRVKGSTRRW